MSYREEIQKLERAAVKAHNADEDARRGWWSERAAAAKEAERQVEAAWIERRNEAKAAANEARAALARARIAWAESGERTPYPLGTRVRRWRHHWGTETYSETTEEGVLEVVTDTTRHPGNRADLAQPGDLVVRLLRASGELGHKYNRVLPVLEPKLAKLWRPVK